MILRILATALLFVLPLAAQAQDPTPVRRTLADPPATIRAEAGLQGAVDMVEAEWQRSAAALAHQLGLDHPAPLEIVLLRQSTFARWSRGVIPEWGAGYASWPHGPIGISVGSSGPKPLEYILRHEVSHVYLGQRAPQAGLPRWFVEGVAQWQAGEWRFLDTMAMVRAASQHGLPTLVQIGGRFPTHHQPAQLAYQVSLYAVSDLLGQREDDAPLASFLDAVVASGHFTRAFRAEFGQTPGEYSAELNGRMQVRYGWLMGLVNATSLFTLGALLLVAAAVRARVRHRRRLAQMNAEEELAEAAEISG